MLLALFIMSSLPVATPYLSELYYAQHATAIHDIKTKHDPIHPASPISIHVKAQKKLPNPPIPDIFNVPQGTIVSQYYSTMTAIVSSRTTGQHYLMLNAHAMYDQHNFANNVFYQPGTTLTNGQFLTDNARKVATGVRAVWRQVGPYYVDASISRIEPGIRYSFEIPKIGLITGSAEPRVGMPVMLYGVNSGFAKGKVTNTNFSDTVTHKSNGIRETYKGACTSTLPAIPGDSGSLIVEEGTNKAVGVHFNTTAKGTEVFCRSTAVEAALGVDFTGKPGVWVDGHLESAQTPSSVSDPGPSLDSTLVPFPPMPFQPGELSGGPPSITAPVGSVPTGYSLSLDTILSTDPKTLALLGLGGIIILAAVFKRR